MECRGARFGIVALTAGALTASVLEAQEVSRSATGQRTRVRRSACSLG